VLGTALSETDNPKAFGKTSGPKSFYIERKGTALYREVCERDLEDIVAKRSGSSYRASRSAWLKIKNRSYSQAERRHELLTKHK